MEKQLKVKLQKAWLEQILKEYKNILWQYNLKIPQATISFTEDKNILGFWDARFYQIIININIVLKYPWHLVLGVLKHEICHQMVSEKLAENALQGPPHGELFQKMAEKISLDSIFRKSKINLNSINNFELNSDEASSDVLSKINKIKKIKTLTASNFQGEKEAATSLMLKLLAKYNLNNFDLEAVNFKREVINLNLRRLSFTLKRIAYLINRYFLVETIFIPVYNPFLDKEEKSLEILGRTANVAIAKFVFTYLEETSQKMWLSYKKENKKANKNSFLLGLFKGFEERFLNNNQVVDKPETEETEEMGKIDFKAVLILKKNDNQLKNYFSKIYPKRSKKSSSVNIYCAESVKIGYEFSEKLKIKYPLSEFKKEIKKLGN